MLAHPSGSASPNLPSESFAFCGAFCVPLNAPPRLSPRSLWFVALTRSACQRHMVTHGRDAILCVRNRSQIGRNKMRPYRGRLGGTPRPTVCQVCASLMGWRMGTRDLPWAARRDASPYHVPSVRVARVWLIGRRKRERLRRIKQHVPTADKGRGKADANGSARGRLDAQDAAETAGAGAGRYSDQARHPVAADGLRRPRTDESRGPRAERRREPQDADVPTVADNAPAQPSGLCEEGRRREQDAPERNLLIVERRGWPRRCPYPQGKARLARYPPHDDRQHTSEHTARQGGSAGRLALPWAIGRRKRERLRRIKRHVPTADKQGGAGLLPVGV